MAARSVAGLVVDAVERVLSAHGFERKGRTFLRREEPAYLIVQIQTDRLRGLKLVLRVTSSVDSQNRGWPINDPFKEGIEYSHSGPAFLDPKEFNEWEIVDDPQAADELGARWAKWLVVRGLDFLGKQAEEVIQRVRS
jgi:hypothetical protein